MVVLRGDVDVSSEATRASRGGDVDSEPGRPGRETKVLLVEDEPVIRALMAEMLSSAGYEVTATCTGDEAAILLAEDGFDLLLTDVTMPGQIDGIGLAEHAREIHPGLPVVFVSGRPDTEQRARGIAPPTAFFTKPYDVKMLVGTVGRLSGGS